MTIKPDEMMKMYPEKFSSEDKIFNHIHRGARIFIGTGGAVLSRNGKTILAIQSTAEDGTVSRIVPFLKEGAGVTLNRGDVHYVVTEYGIAYLHGKNIRERAMELICIAHPKFRSWLIQEAKQLNLIYKDQAFIPGKRGEYPEEHETHRTTKTGLEIFLRPVKISGEPLLKDFFYSLSDNSLYRRFISRRKDMPHEPLHAHRQKSHARFNGDSRTAADDVGERARID